MHTHTAHTSAAVKKNLLRSEGGVVTRETWLKGVGREGWQHGMLWHSPSSLFVLCVGAQKKTHPKKKETQAETDKNTAKNTTTTKVSARGFSKFSQILFSVLANGLDLWLLLLPKFPPFYTKHPQRQPDNRERRRLTHHLAPRREPPPRTPKNKMGETSLTAKRRGEKL